MARPRFDNDKWYRFPAQERCFVRTCIDKQRTKDFDDDIREALSLESGSEYIREIR